MSDIVTLLPPDKIDRNEDNPRLIFHEDELRSLAESIKKQGILVPLTVFKEGRIFRILDGERRWRCALSLGLSKVPVIVQPKPDRMTNIMMMFAIHNARKDWDPLPTALKLEDLEKEFKRKHGYSPSESELAGISSLPRGEIRRLKKLLNLPREYRRELLHELEKPRSQQSLTVDQVIETTAGVEALQKRGVIEEADAEPLRRSILQKFRDGIIVNTVAPRKLANLARAIERGEVTVPAARRALEKLKNSENYTIEDVYLQTVERADLEHALEQLAGRLETKLDDLVARGMSLSDKTKDVLRALRRAIGRHV